MSPPLHPAMQISSSSSPVPPLAPTAPKNAGRSLARCISTRDAAPIAAEAQALPGAISTAACAPLAHMAVMEDLDTIAQGCEPRIIGVLPAQRFIDTLRESAATRRMLRFAD